MRYDNRLKKRNIFVTLSTRIMLRYNQYNNLIGWVMFLASMIVYSLTVEPSVPLWDCGEFISASNGLQVVHPPGAPFFLLLGRIFSFLAPITGNVALAVNMLSVVASAGTVMFTFWITTHFARKILGHNLSVKEINLKDAIQVFGAGAVSALALTFMDSFWFSAVEAEVYAASSFFTALTFWAIVKWETVKDEPRSDRWLVFIAYSVGLSIGVHLLNLLVIPAVVLYYFFNKYPITNANILRSLAIGIGSLLFLNFLVLPGIPTFGAAVDRLFVNSFSLPYLSGLTVTALLVTGLLLLGIRYTIRNNKPLINLALVCFTFVMMGFASYAIIPIRSLADPAIDMNDPQDAQAMKSYIKREQYGERPLLKGPYYFANQEVSPVRAKEGAMQYRRGEDKYEPTGRKVDYVWPESHTTIFPRMGDMTDKAQGYKYWYDEKKNADGTTKVPTFGQNIGFFVKYQMGWMYWRYFFWNFAGRQSDIQNFDANPWDGNWLSGINIIDKGRLGTQKDIPASLTTNKARNKYYMLPFLLGLAGLFYQYRRSRNDALTILLLFVFTGLLIIVYLNQPPLEPRERDYASVGSFQTFCIWIGLGALALGNFLGKYMNRKSAAIVGIAAGMFGAPYLMGSENWDDHDRSDRYLGLSFAKNYLNSCEENAILFTNGDNDTYPLWYAQNVEGIRTDVRIINLSLLSTEWYADALTRKYYESDPLPMTIMPKVQLKDGIDRDILRYVEDPQKRWQPAQAYELRAVLNWMVSDNPQEKAAIYRGQGPVNFLPAKNMAIPIDKEAAIASGTVKPEDADRIVDYIMFKYPGNAVLKGTITMLDIIATNAERGWERPIYFTTTTGNETFAGMQDYFRHEGLTYRLVPLRNSFNQTRGLIDNDLLYDRLMNDFAWGNMDKGEMFLDHKASLVPRNLKVLFAQVANQYIQQGDMDKARELIDEGMRVIPESIMPMDPQLRNYYTELYYSSGDTAMARQLLREHVKDLEDQTRYYNSMRQSAKLDMRNQILSKLSGVLEGVTGAQRLARVLKDEESGQRIQGIIDAMPSILLESMNRGNQGG